MKIYLVTDKIIDSPISLLHGLTVKDIPGDGGGGAFIEWVVEYNMKTSHRVCLLSFSIKPNPFTYPPSIYLKFLLKVWPQKILQHSAVVLLLLSLLGMLVCCSLH